MLQVVEPEYKIEIGIKNGEVVSIHWGYGFLHAEKLKEVKDIKKRLITYYKKAIKYAKSMEDQKS